MESLDTVKMKCGNLTLDVFCRELVEIELGLLSGLVLGWRAQTSIGNIVWIRILMLDWMFPFFHIIEGFVDTNTSLFLPVKTLGFKLQEDKKKWTDLIKEAKK